MAQVGEELAQWACPITEPSLVLVPTQNEQLIRLLGKWAWVPHPKEDVLTPKYKEAH